SAKLKAFSALAGGLLVLTAGAGLLFGGLTAGDVQPTPGPEKPRSEPAPAPSAPVARGPGAPQAPKADPKPPDPRQVRDRLHEALSKTENEIARLSEWARRSAEAGIVAGAMREDLLQELRKIRAARRLAEQVDEAIQSAVNS